MTGYPYLSLAKQRGIPYGFVLAYVDVINVHCKLPCDVWMNEACRTLSLDDRKAIRETFYHECQRRTLFETETKLGVKPNG